MSPNGIERERDYRLLTQSESKLLDTLLATDFPGRTSLVDQVRLSRVRTIDSNGSLKFSVCGPSPANVVRRIPVEAETEDADGVIVHVLLHVAAGYLSELEIYREDSADIQRAIVSKSLRTLVL